MAVAGVHMSMDRSVRDRIADFRATVAPDQYDVSGFIPWEGIEHELEASYSAVTRLQELIDGDRLTETELAQLLVEESSAVSVLNHLFVTPAGAGFRDGRELPAEGPLDLTAATAAASVAIELGLARILRPGARVADLYRIGAIALDSRRRGFRRRDDLSSFVDVLIDSAVEDAQASAGLRLDRLPAAAQPDALREKAREIVAAEGRPVAAIATVFQSSSGGRQQRDLAFTYPRLQEDLDQFPVALILIADGRGLAETPQRVLETLFDSVAACMTVQEARSGALADALESAALNRGARASRRVAVRTLIASALDERLGVSATDLPTSPEAARLALSEYHAEHPDRALDLSAGGSQLTWRQQKLVAEAQALKRESSRSDRA